MMIEGMEHMELVSVIVPVYNAGEYLAPCVDSLRNQTYAALEIILVDDGSTDGSGAACDAFARKDSRIRVIHQENGGLSAARNAGIDAAKGDYLTFVDADDMAARGLIRRLLKVARETDCDIAIAGFERFSREAALTASETGSSVRLVERLEALSIINRLMDEEAVNYITAWGKLYKRRLFAQLRYPAGKWHEDEFLAHQLLGEAHGIVMVTEKLYYYRQHPGSFMGQNDLAHQLLHLSLLDALAQRVEYDAAHAPTLVSDAVHHLLQQCNAFCNELPRESACRQARRQIHACYRNVYFRYFRSLSMQERVSGGLFAICPDVYLALTQARFRIKQSSAKETFNGSV